MGYLSLTSSFLLLLLLLLLLPPFCPFSLGQRPGCEHCDRHFACDCSRAGYRLVPVATHKALTLDLSLNAITAVMDTDLQGHNVLRVLRLQGNGLRDIQPRAFFPLLSLVELDLSDNLLFALNSSWFRKLTFLQRLNLLNNPYRSLDPHPVFQGLFSLRRLGVGGAELEELRKGALDGVRQLEELILYANNLQRYEPGTLADMWPLGRVVLSLHAPFWSNASLASAVVRDVSYPETPVVLCDLHLTDNVTVAPLSVIASRRVRSLMLRNLSMSDEAMVNLLIVFNGSTINTFMTDGVTLIGEGRWEQAKLTDHKSLDEVFIRNAVVLNIWRFVSFLRLGFLLKYPRKVSVIGSNVFALPCETSRLLVNLEYLDLSENLLTDLTLRIALCQGDGSLRDLRVLNISGNPVRSLASLADLVAKLSKLTHLVVSNSAYSSMPEHCSWPPTLRHLNLSWAKFTAVTPCLPPSLEVLDVSHNNLLAFSLALPGLIELHLTGNKMLRLPAGRQFPNLQILTIQSNTLSMFSRSDLQSYERLQKLEAGQNKFVCSCEFVSFLQSHIAKGGGEDNGPQLMDNLESYVCDSPLHHQAELVNEVRFSPAECHLVAVVSGCCVVALAVAGLLGVLLWRLHAFWYAKMIWAWLKAKRNSASCHRLRRASGSETPLCYDAFVSYSERDATWVDNFLIPELEEPREEAGQRPLSLCLHKRDFLPGPWIIDNISRSMERSRCTIFILSEHFVRSNWCRYELDFSHFRLFGGDAAGGAAVLVLLEPLRHDAIPRRFCRLRRLMAANTYLEWPREEEKRDEFWARLREAVIGEEEEEGDGGRAE